MNIKDRVYGNQKIISPVIIELIQSKTFQRLKGISQHNVPKRYNYIKREFSRCDHSIGVMIVLKILNATEEEQIAGLLHDVSHTAFSHMIDWVLGSSKTQDFQDKRHEEVIKSSDIPSILGKYNYDVDRIINYLNFPLLERKIPDICADRLDYSLREFSRKNIDICLKNLDVLDDMIIFKTKESAKVFAINFLKREAISWSGFESVVRSSVFARILQISLEKKFIDIKDFNKNDKYVLEKIYKANNSNINRALKILENRSLKKFELSDRVFYSKFRYTDPIFLIDNKKIRLSEYDNEFKSILNKQREKEEKGFRIPKVFDFIFEQ